MYSSLKLPVVLGFAICLASCEAGGAAVPRATALPSSSTVAEAVVATPKSGERKTTSSEIALANLSGQISSYQQRVQRIPNDISSREKLVGLLLARTQYLGTYDDFDSAFQIVDDALERELAPARTALLHARVLSSVHRFKSASAELDRAESLGSGATQPLRETIALATGQDFAAITKTRSELANELPSYASLTKLAASLTKSERFEESDAAYQEALERYRDVSPFPHAWVAFQRGMIWGELADDSARAYEQYQIAVARLPQYIVGNVHLSEIEVELGNAEAAIARLERIVDTTADPEPASRLAEYLSDADPERAARYKKQAHVGYQKLLTRYPLAFADHATEFYLGAGDDPNRALDLALLNLGNRKTQRAYGLAIEAATAAGRPVLVCKLVREAKLPTHGTCNPPSTL
jgi:tetratricopeptide (TPR) repeat protein